MDLKEAWKTLEKEKLSKPVLGSISIPGHSKHPVANIILTFTGSLAFCILFEVIFAGILFSVEQNIVKASLLLVMAIYAFLFWINLRVLRKVKRLHQSDDSILNSLRSIHQIVTDTINFQEKFSWIFFPLCVAAGFLLGISMTKDAAALIIQPKFYLTLLLTMLAMTPACFYLTRWLVKISHGKYLKQIEGLIAQAEGD